MEREYTVYFEIYGKKMRTTVLAKSESHAQEIVRSKLIIHKAEKSQSEFNRILDITSEMLDKLG